LPEPAPATGELVNVRRSIFLLLRRCRINQPRRVIYHCGGLGSDFGVHDHPLVTALKELGFTDLAFSRLDYDRVRWRVPKSCAVMSSVDLRILPQKCCMILTAIGSPRSYGASIAGLRERL
jgi:hypothetical protein